MGGKPDVGDATGITRTCLTDGRGQALLRLLGPLAAYAGGTVTIASMGHGEGTPLSSGLVCLGHDSAVGSRVYISWEPSHSKLLQRIGKVKQGKQNPEQVLTLAPWSEAELMEGSSCDEQTKPRHLEGTMPDPPWHPHLHPQISYRLW